MVAMPAPKLPAIDSRIWAIDGSTFQARNRILATPSQLHKFPEALLLCHLYYIPNGQVPRPSRKQKMLRHDGPDFNLRSHPPRDD